MKLYSLLNKAQQSHIKAEGAAPCLLEGILDFIIADEEDDVQQKEKLGCEHNPADGFIINDDSGNNYSVTSIIEYIDQYGAFRILDLKKFSI